jgi:hypothetical protein
MRRLLVLFACVTGLAAASAAAPPRKSAPKPKSPALQGTPIRSVDMDLRLIIPMGWEPLPGLAGAGQNTVKSKRSPIYHYVASVDKVEVKGPITFYSPPQFYIESADLTGIVNENEISPAQQDEIAKAIVEKSNKTAVNFRYEGSRRITVDGEPATAFACVATMPRTQDLMRFRVISMFRNKQVYVFVFAAPVDDFPRFDPIFTKTLQNYHFLSPRKKNAPRPVAPEDVPLKSEGVF